GAAEDPADSVPAKHRRPDIPAQPGVKRGAQPLEIYRHTGEAVVRDDGALGPGTGTKQLQGSALRLLNEPVRRDLLRHPLVMKADRIHVSRPALSPPTGIDPPDEIWAAATARHVRHERLPEGSSKLRTILIIFAGRARLRRLDNSPPGKRAPDTPGL